MLPVGQTLEALRAIEGTTSGTAWVATCSEVAADLRIEEAQRMSRELGLLDQVPEILV
jgi:hypothetical protein